MDGSRVGYMWNRRDDSKVYEYACHEGNYAMGNVLEVPDCSKENGREGRYKRGDPEVGAGGSDRVVLGLSSPLIRYDI